MPGTTACVLLIDVLQTLFPSPVHLIIHICDKNFLLIPSEMIAGGHGLPVVHGDRREGLPFGRGFRQPAVFPRGNHRQGEMKDIWEPYLNDDCKIFVYLDHLTPTSALGPHSVLAHRTRYRIHATATLTLDLHFGDPLTASGLDRDQCGSHITYKYAPRSE